MAIIGAGIVGLTAAYELARQGYDVALADADHPGKATDAGAGIVNPLDLLSTESAAERARRAIFAPDRYPGLIAALVEDGQADHGYSTAGQLVVTADGNSLHSLSARLSQLGTVSAYLGHIRAVNAAEAATLVPFLTDGFHGILLPGVARVDGRKLSAALHAALAERGVPVRHGVARLLRAGDRAVGIEVGADRIDAEQIIVATGAWPVGDAALDAVLHNIRPDRGQILHLSNRMPFPAPVPIVSLAGGSYILNFPPDRIVAGATHDDAGFDCRATAAGVAAVLADALHVGAGLADATVLETRIGFRPVSRDGLPVLGPVPGLLNVVVATGLGAHGLTLGPAVGGIAARLASGKEPGMDISAVQPDRLIA